MFHLRFEWGPASDQRGPTNFTIANIYMDPAQGQGVPLDISGYGVCNGKSLSDPVPGLQ